MTRNEAIEWLTDIKNVAENWSQEVAVDMAIDALKREARFLTDLENNTPTDLISREEVLRTIITAGEVEPDLGYTHLHDVIASLPSADRPSEERLLQEIKHLKEQNNQLNELYTALSVNTKGDNE